MTIKEMIAVMQAYEDGEKIEYREIGVGNWESVSHPCWNWSVNEYRVKPEPKYVPYDDVSEVEKDKWVKSNRNGKLYRILKLDPIDNSVGLYCGWATLEELFENYTYEDDTTCGKKVEE